MRVMVSTSWPVRAWQIPAEYVDRLRARFPDVEFEHVAPGADVYGPIERADICLCSYLKPDMVDRAARLRWLHSPAAAVDDLLPLRHMAGRGITITNARGVQAVAIAEHVMAGLLILARRYDLIIQAQQRREWIQEQLGEVDRPALLVGRRMTIVGLGTIGQELARRAHPFGMHITGVRRRAALGAPAGVDRVVGPDGLDEALDGCDIAVIAAPFVAATKGLIGAGELARMAAGAILVNVGRANIVDQAAMLDALQRGHLGGAVLDVFAGEPLNIESPLWAMPNVLVSPHSSGFRSTHWDGVIDGFSENLRRYRAGEPLLNLVDPDAGY